MNVLIIDNGTSYLSALKKLLRDHKLTIIHWSNNSLPDVSAFDLIILSGSRSYSVVYDQDKLEKEIDLIKSTEVPLLGICLGCELIAYSFGAKLELLSVKEKGIVTIEILLQADIFGSLKNFEVYESHRWAIKELGDSIVGMAKSKDGFEVIKHIQRPLYGLQFHPEMFSDSIHGREVFENIFKSIEASV